MSGDQPEEYIGDQRNDLHPRLMATSYDAIIIGTGAGGGTLALHLAQAGKNILILERGPFMPQEKLNWDTSAVFLDNRYHTKEVWETKDGKDLHPQQAYFVGGQTKVYGAAMFRMRAEDFGVVHHKGGISPAWPITYADMELYYTQAEELFHVHGDLGTAPPVPGGFGSSFDPTEPFHSKKYPFPALANEPRMQSIEDDVRKLGVHTFPIPLGLKRNEADPLASTCVRCDTCDGYPCLVHAKSDADINCIRQIMHLPNVTLMTNSRVTRLLTNSAARQSRQLRWFTPGLASPMAAHPIQARPMRRRHRNRVILPRTRAACSHCARVPSTRR
jgi:choline dehydrogenase-like flavoprotein